MQYRTIPKIDFKPSALGFGAMRLPVIDNNQAKVNYPEATKIIRCAIDNGVNYLDTAYFYHGGFSETAVGKALENGYREKIKLATKFPAWEVKSRADFDAAFERQLRRLQTAKVDFYLLHGLHRPVWDNLKEMGIIPWLEGKIAKGQIDYAGFSFHDELDYFKKIVDAYDNWTFCQVHYNYMDVDYQAGRRGIEYAAGKNLGVFIMEPLRGGQLAQKPPQPVAKMWEGAKVKRSPVDWALRWLWNNPDISLVLSGMSTMEQVIENVAVADKAGNSKLTKAELALIDKVRQAYKDLRPIPCTGCRYCMPCENNVEIPGVFSIYNELKMYGDTRIVKFRYGDGQWAIKPNQNASNCIACGKCAEKCPQHIEIYDWLKKAHEELMKHM
jgi:uncharacterized protein